MKPLCSCCGVVCYDPVDSQAQAEDAWVLAFATWNAKAAWICRRCADEILSGYVRREENE